MTKLFISVVSHNHLNLILSLNCLTELSELPNAEIIIKTNTNEEQPEILKKNNIHFLSSPSGIGFGHNNNEIFDYCQNSLDIKDTDYFIVLNPDVYIAKKELLNLITLMNEENIFLSAINLYKNKQLTEYDNSIRKFPTFMTFFMSFIGRGNDSIYDKNKINQPTKIDWAAGSFLAFNAAHYNRLKGFDTRYFMYCEDIDICYRSMC